MKMTPELEAKKRDGARYAKLMAERPDLKPQALRMIDDGKTLGEIADALDGDGNVGWKKAVAKINARHDAMRT